MAVEPKVRPHRIALDSGTGRRYDEARAAADVLPGMLCEFVPGLTDEDEVQPHSAVGGRGELLFALEDGLGGSGGANIQQGKSIEDLYETDPLGDGSQKDLVFLYFPQPGDRVFAAVANGESGSKGDLLVSNGDGYLKAATAGTGDEEEIIAEALEDFDITDTTSHVRTRIVPQAQG